MLVFSGRKIALRHRRPFCCFVGMGVTYIYISGYGGPYKCIQWKKMERGECCSGGCIVAAAGRRENVGKRDVYLVSWKDLRDLFRWLYCRQMKRGRARMKKKTGYSISYAILRDISGVYCRHVWTERRCAKGNIQGYLRFKEIW